MAGHRSSLSGSNEGGGRGGSKQLSLCLLQLQDWAARDQGGWDLRSQVTLEALVKDVQRKKESRIHCCCLSEKSPCQVSPTVVEEGDLQEENRRKQHHSSSHNGSKGNVNISGYAKGCHFLYEGTDRCPDISGKLVQESQVHPVSANLKKN